MKIVALLLALAFSSLAIAYSKVMTKLDNGDGTVTYTLVEDGGGSTETVPKAQSAAYEQKAKEDGIEIKDITPKK